MKKTNSEVKHPHFFFYLLFIAFSWASDQTTGGRAAQLNRDFSEINRIYVLNRITSPEPEI